MVPRPHVLKRHGNRYIYIYREIELDSSTGLAGAVLKTKRDHTTLYKLNHGSFVQNKNNPKYFCTKDTKLGVLVAHF